VSEFKSCGDYAGRKNVSLSVKIQGYYYSFDIAESEYVNQISLSPTKGEKKGLN